MSNYSWFVILYTITRYGVISFFTFISWLTWRRASSATRIKLFRHLAKMFCTCVMFIMEHWLFVRSFIKFYVIPHGKCDSGTFFYIYLHISHVLYYFFSVFRRVFNGHFRLHILGFKVIFFYLLLVLHFITFIKSCVVYVCCVSALCTVIRSIRSVKRYEGLKMVFNIAHEYHLHMVLAE